MVTRRVVGGLLALSMLLGGSFLSLAGLGYVGASADTSIPWAVGGAWLAGMGVALTISLVRRR